MSKEAAQVVSFSKPTNRGMARDAAAIRKMAVKTLRQFRSGEISVVEAQHVATLSKRALDAMKIEFLCSPPTHYEPVESLVDDSE